MKNTKEELALSNVLKRAELKAPNPLLTEHILEQIQQEQMEVSSSTFLFKRTLKKAETIAAPTDISQKIISQLEAQKQSSIAIRPLINKNVKYAYSILMSLGILYLIFSGSFSLNSLLESFNKYSSSFTLIFTSCLCLIALALLDVIIKKRKSFYIY